MNPIYRGKRRDPALEGAKYPAGYIPDADRPNVFDPALRQFLAAVVKGPPAAARSEHAAARTQGLEIALEAIAASPIRDLLVVRGSVTLAAWYGGAARRPRDLDLVVREPAWKAEGSDARWLLGELLDVVSAALHASGAELAPAATSSPDEGRRAPRAASIDAIWTYERAEGRRVTVPFVLQGTEEILQMDVVFEEPLHEPARLTPLVSSARPGGGGVADAAAWFASKGESLAWKLLWLQTDKYAQGKDLYDAVLLAEDIDAPHELIRRVFEAKGQGDALSWVEDPRLDLTVDWREFIAEYPDLAGGDVEVLVHRLVHALKRGRGAAPVGKEEDARAVEDAGTHDE